jgi:hypothetical protein
MASGNYTFSASIVAEFVSRAAIHWLVSKSFASFRTLVPPARNYLI